MRVDRFSPDPDTEPRYRVRHDQAFAMMLRPGSVEWGSKRCSLGRFDYTAGDLALCDRHAGEWVGLMNVSHLQLGISDAALMACSDGAYGEVELRPQRFPSGRLFLDSVEQAMAVTLVHGHAVRHRPVQLSRGGLGPVRLRRIKELVDAKMENDLSLDEMAQSVGLSTAHFARMFRKSTGETPHQFVLRQRLERAKSMLRAPLPMLESWTSPLPAALKPSSTLRRTCVTSGDLARQNIARTWSPQQLARVQSAPKMRHAWRWVVSSQKFSAASCTSFLTPSPVQNL